MNFGHLKSRFLFCLLLLFAIAPFAAAENGDVPFEPDIEAVYLFHEHLLSAQAVTLAKGKPIQGEWKDKRFVFPGFGEQAHIYAVQDAIDSTPQEVLIFNPVEKTTRKILFPDVPPGAKLVLYYKLTNADKKTKKHPYLFLRIRAGRHELKGMRLFSGSGEAWKKEVLSLGVASFLRLKMPIHFEVSSDVAEGLEFRFYAEILR